MSLHHFTSVPEELREFLSFWTGTPAGPQKDAALGHYLKASHAHLVGDAEGCLRALSAAHAALH